jgi:DNA-binding LacI/PurR family transcriptional regulator
MSTDATARTGPATAADVAAIAGVSRTTVSHILNGRGDRFPAGTRDRVLAAAKELDYRPSPAGRNLVNGRSDTVVVVAPNATWGPNLQDSVEQVARDVEPFGGTAFVRFVGAEEGSATVSSILTLRPLAVVDLGVLTPADRQRLADHGVATVPSTTSIDANRGLDRTIAEMQLQELTRAGARAIAFGALSDTRLDRYGPPRFAHLVDLCGEAGLPEPIWVDIALDVERATSALAAIADDGPIGFACYNDDVALAVLAAARRLGRRVPEDVAVVGVDHTAIGQLWSPPLTTIDVDVRAIMDAAIRDLHLAADRGAPTPSERGELARLIRGGTS